MNFKCIILVSLLISYICIIWYTQNITILGMFKNSQLSFFETLLTMNNSAFGYTSMQAYCLFFTVPYLVFHIHFFPKEEAITIVRQKSRSLIYCKRLKQLCITSMIISGLHFGINILFTSIVLPNGDILETRFLQAGVINAISIWVFFVTVGMLFYFLRDVLHSVTYAFFSTSLILATLFYLQKLIFPEYWWGPVKDLVLFYKWLGGEWGSLDVTLVVFRQLLIAFSMAYIGYIAWARRDLYNE